MKLKLHHVGMVVPDIGPARDVYAQRFGYEAQSAVVHDPIQTAHVQFFRLREDRTFLEFVSPDGVDSKLAGAAGKAAGLHHLCFSTEDIEDDCRQLRARGMTLIQRPVSASAFPGRRIAWLVGRDRVLIELVERQGEGL